MLTEHVQVHFYEINNQYTYYKIEKIKIELIWKGKGLFYSPQFSVF